MVIRAAVCLMIFIGSNLPAMADDVVELFTSQGCSACPPADRVLGRLAREPGVIALTFPVDYWDFLGWKDPNARPEFTHRQRAYARARGDRAVFTPQVVINGREAVIGSNEGSIRTAIATMAERQQSPNIAISARIEGDRVKVEVPAAEIGGGDQAALWIAAFRRPTRKLIERGENAGRELVYYNIVDRWQVLGMWDGAPLSVELPLADVAPDNTAGLAVILQTKTQGLPGPIIGAAEIRIKDDGQPTDTHALASD